MLSLMLNPYQKKGLTIAKEQFEKVKEKPNILAVFENFYPEQKLRRSGKATLACCPFHGENHPSFAMYEETNTYFCFACGEKGDSFNFIMQMENIGFKEAVQFAQDNNLYD